MNQQIFKWEVFSLIVLLICEEQLNVNAVSVENFLSLSFKEKAALDQFRFRVEPILEDNCMRRDTYLIRWLRARNFDISAAERMLRENLRWRKENKIDNIKHEDLRDMEQDFHLTLDTYDKKGQPIGVVDVYEWDLRRVVLQGKVGRLRRFMFGLIENITSQVCERQQKGMNVTQVVVLANADGVNVVQQVCPICLPLWIEFVTTIENYYPEWIDEFIVIDSSPAVELLMNTVRPIFSRSTRNAIKVFGHNRNIWMAYLDNKISKNERRKRYGGTKASYNY